MTLTPDDILAADGAIARRLEHYELRSEQLEMARAVYRALTEKRHLVVEAGTGVGKSFAYLVPAILAATDEQAPLRRVIVSTHTIGLQEQLIQKDLPLLNSVIPREFSVVLVKGRGNYLSRRRLKLAQDHRLGLFSRDDETAQLDQLVSWARTTQDGSLADLPVRPPHTVWDEVASDGNNCMGRKCPTYKECFYYRARRRAQHAQILIVNHALFFSALALSETGYDMLPAYDAVIFDEAHTLESVAAEHLGMRITSGQVEFALRKLYNDRTQNGLLVIHSSIEGQQLVDTCYAESDDFFAQVDEWWQEQLGGNGRVTEPGQFTNNLSPRLRKLAQLVRARADQVVEESSQLDLHAAARRLLALAESLTAWCQQAGEGNVYWVERQVNRWNRLRIQLCMAPIDISQTLNESLFQKTGSVVLTSATLTVGKNASFRFFQNRLGLTSADSKRLGSPFNYARQARIVIPPNMPDPTSQRDAFEASAADVIQRYVQLTDGRAFVLCTSYQMLRALSARLIPWLTKNKLTLYSQGDGAPRTLLLENFKRNPRGVLFGTDSFWQGVDVPGDALANVIIPKLPFSVPDHPLLQARLEAIRQRGGNPFHEYQLPEAIIKFKQGFGRLIRSHRDHGIVVILDPRVRTKYYGRAFLESLPECPVSEELLTW